MRKRARLASATKRLDDFLERAYRRNEKRYVDVVMLWLLGGVSGFVVPFFSSLLIPLYDLPIVDYLSFVALFQLTIVPVVGCSMYFFAHRRAKPLFAWGAGERGPAAAEAAWTAAVVGTPSWLRPALVLAWIGTLPGAVVVGIVQDFPAFGYPAFAFTLATLVAVAGVFYFLLFDQGIRPVVRDIAAHLPHDFVPPDSLSLGSRLSAAVPIISYFTALAIAALAYNSLGPEAYMVVMAATASFMSLTFAFLSSVVIRQAVVGRIDDLGTAMRSIDAGDLDTYVPPLAGDEIDDLAAKLNRMVEGLREREALRDDLRDSRARLVAAADAERRRMERDLHDGAQQHLVLLRLQIRAVERRLGADDPAVGELRSGIDQAMVELRDLAHGIYPAALEADGLAAALREASTRGAVPVAVEADDARFPREIEAAVYFCCLEALQNAGKHGGEGTSAKVTVAAGREGALDFTVTDTGPGFDVAAANSSHGLQNMRDRIGALGGRLEICSAPGAGTTVRGTVPAGASR